VSCLVVVLCTRPAPAQAAAAGTAPTPPAYLIAEPAPNDNGTHVIVRWPRAEGEPPGQRHAVYISRDSDSRRFLCELVTAAEGSITGPAVSPFHPYHFRDDGQVYYVVSPLEVRGFLLHWLHAERRYGGWLAERRAMLQQSESSLSALKDRIEERRDLLRKLAAYRPTWERRAKEPGPRQSTFGQYLANAEKRAKEADEAVGAARDAIFDDLTGYLIVDALIRCEAQAAMGRSHPEETARAVAAAQERVRAAGAGGAEYDEYDRLSYVQAVAASSSEAPQAPTAREAIVEQVLGRASELLSQADLPTAATEAAGPPAGPALPHEAKLTQALTDWHRALARFEHDGAPEAEEQWKQAQAALDQATVEWKAAAHRALEGRFLSARPVSAERDYLREELSGLRSAADAYGKRLKELERAYARRPYCFRLAWVDEAGTPTEPFDLTACAAARPSLFDVSKLANLIYALGFTALVLLMVVYVRRHPDVFVRRIPGLEAVEEAIGRATEMGKPVLFVHGLTGVGDIAVLASINILGRIAREVAQYDSDLIVANTDPIVYSLSQEVVQEAYLEAGRPDAFNPDNVLMVASEQFPYVAAVAGIMARRRPAANFLMGYFYAEALILAEAGASSGAIQIAATDSFTQLPFFITTCDYTLMGEELYAASAYLSRNARMLATLKAQDLGKTVLLAALPAGMALSNVGLNWIQVIFRAYEKGF
jgi:hypothetical protein